MTVTTSNQTNKDDGDDDNVDNHDPFWNKYIPSIPINSGDRRPGTQGGPCGETDYHNFGPCYQSHLVCVGLRASRPGICHLNMSSAHEVVMQSMQDLTLAHIQLEMALNKREKEEEDKHDLESQGGNGTTTPDFPEPEPMTPQTMLNYSVSTYIVIVLGMGVIYYFCVFKPRRSAYRQVGTGDRESWGGDRT
jgi:hypothetical protein